MLVSLKKQLRSILAVVVAAAVLWTDGTTAWAGNGFEDGSENQFIEEQADSSLSLNRFFWPDDEGRYTVSRTTGIVEGNEYLLVVAAGIITDASEITIDNISANTLYLDQKQGGSGGVAFESFALISSGDATVILAGEGMTPEILGYIAKDAVKFKGFYINEGCTEALKTMYEVDASSSLDGVMGLLPTAGYALFDVAGKTSIVAVTFDWNRINGEVGKIGSSIEFGCSVQINDGTVPSEISSLMFPVEARVYVIDPDAVPGYITATKGNIIYNIGDTISDDDVLVRGVYNDGRVSDITEFTTNVSSLSTAKAGTKKLEITAGGLKTTLSLTVLSAKAKPTFQVNYETFGGSYVAPQAVAGALKAFSGNPYKNGYDFTGWYADEACTTLFVLGTTITENTTLYAGWSETGVITPVKLEASLKNPTIYVGEVLTEDNLTVKVTYSDKSVKEVTGYDSDILTMDTTEEGTRYITVSYSEGGKTLTTQVVVRVTLEGLVKTFSVNFDSCNGDDVFTQIIPEGQLAQTPDDPVKPGFMFAGWYNGNTKYDFKKAVTGNLNLTARWAAGRIVGDSGLYVYLEDCGDYIYTGSSITPLPIVMDNSLNILKNKTDYSISYKNNKAVSTETSKASFTIKAKGNYAGSITVEFDINAMDISDEEAVNVTTTEFVKYNKKGVSPVPTVKYGKVQLKNKTDYDLKYEKLSYKEAGSGTEVTAPLKEAGWYRMVLTGKGNYTGTREVRFKYASSSMINLANTTVTVDKNYKTVNYTGNPVFIDDFVTVKNKKITLVQGTDYELVYESDNTNPGTVTIAVKEVDGNETYYGVKRFSFAIKGLSLKDAKVSLAASSVTYNGGLWSDNISDVTIRTTSKNQAAISRLAGEEYEIGQYYHLVPDQDYSATYSKAFSKGTATINLTGMGLFTGTYKKTFTINPLSLKKDTDKVTVTVPNAIQSRAGAVPNVKVTMITDTGEITLTEGVDYTIKCSSNTNATDKAKAVITGKGNFKDSVTAYYKVLPKSVKGPGIVIDVPDMLPGKVKAGQTYKPTVKVTDNGKGLKAKSDYTVDYSGALTYEAYQSGEKTGSVTINGTGKSYTGSIRVEYEVAAVNLNDKSVTIAIQDMYYTGSAITFDLSNEADRALFTATHKSGEEIDVLTPGEDFEIVSYKNNVKAGTATVTLRGIGDYAGTKSVKFKITKCPLD